MKVFLALPPHSLEDRYNKAIAKAAGSLPPLGILYLAAVLKKEGHPIQVCDGSKEDYPTMMSRIRDFKPDIIGFSTMAFTWHNTKKMIKKLKEEFPNTKIALGGNHATIYKKRCLKESQETDLVMINECEETIVEVVDALENNKKLNKIKGLIYREGKSIKETEQRPLIQNLDSLPFPARELIDIKDYVPALEQYKKKPVTNVMTARGCPFNCIFCTSRRTGLRLRSPQNVFEELKELVEKYKVREVAFWDDTFTIVKKRVVEISRLIKENKLDLIWSAQSRVNTIDQETLKEMKKAGCWKIFYGVESLVQKNLDTIKKGITPQQAFDAIKWTRKAGIESEASFIFGIPGETYEEALTTIKLVKKLNPDYAKFFQFTVFEGLERKEDISKTGKIIAEDMQNVTGNSVTFVPNSMTKEELESLVPLAYRKFYFRPSYFLSYLKKIRNFEDIKKSFRGFLAVSSLKK